MEKGLILGEPAFAAISAVEGIFLSVADTKQLTDWRAEGLDNDAIRARLLAQFRDRKAA